MKITLSALLMICLSIGIHFEGGNSYAGTGNSVWTNRSENFTVKGERRIIPQQYRTISADLSSLTALLRTAPIETDSRINDQLRIELPKPDGTMSLFSVVEYSMMEPGLAAKFPDFKTYTLKGIDDPYATGKMDITEKGFHAMVLSVNGTYYIDPYSTDEREIYISYFKKDVLHSQNFECHVDESMTRDVNQGVIVEGGLTAGPILRSYRLAMATTGEYAVYHGGTVPAAMSAIVTAMNRVNGVYEKDLSVRMILVANNDQIVFTNSGSDPYSNNNGGAMLGQNQSTCDNIIGSSNYDIGHVFSTGGGGVAYLGCVCSNGLKAGGVTGLPSPIGDPFYIDYVAHEVGHQFGGNHSFNSIVCNSYRNPSTAWEPGSGTTIMGYAGICGSDNTQSNSDDIFHTGNFSEMVIFTQFGGGSTCAVNTNTGNTAPSVTVPAGGFTIPVGTPFALKGSATDVENPNSITYIWEEMDLGPPGSPNNPSGNAPIFRSFKTDTSSTRTFPRLSNLLNNTQTIGEILPTYTRLLTFRLTARDNNAGGGGVAYGTVEFNVDASAGPFLVTYPNTNVTISNQGPVTVTWNVANTTAAPVNCANVNIKLSTDGGNTYPVTLAANTPNDGSESVTMPGVSTTARIKVEAVGNVFFDISNSNFTITSSTAISNNGTGIPSEFSLMQNYPNPFNPVTKIAFDIPFNSNVTLKIIDIQGRELQTIANGSFNAGSYTADFNGAGLASGIYFYKISAVSEKQNFEMVRKMTLLK